MDTLEKSKQELRNFLKGIALAGLVYLIFACAVGLFAGTFAVLFGWISLGDDPNLLLHCGKLAAFAAVGAVSLHLFRKLLAKSAQPEQNPAAETLASEHSNQADQAYVLFTSAEVSPPPTVTPSGQPEEPQKPKQPTQPPRISFNHGPNMDYFLTREPKGFHLTHHPRDRYDPSPIIDQWLTPDYFKTHSVEEFCAWVEGLCPLPGTTLDRNLMAKKLLDAHFITSTFVVPKNESPAAKHDTPKDTTPGQAATSNFSELPISSRGLVHLPHCSEVSVKQVEVSPVVQQHYWKCVVNLKYDGTRWILEITDVFAVNRWQDDDATSRTLAPGNFPNITPDQLAARINSTAPGGPGYGGHRNVKPAEVAPLIQAARDYLKGCAEHDTGKM